MTPRRPRTFSDHKGPLVAFVLVAVACIGLLVHVARSDAAPAWLRDGDAAVVAGGAPLIRQAAGPAARGRHPAEPTPAPTAPAVTPPATVVPDPPEASGTERPDAAAAPAPHEGRITPDLQSPPPSAPGVTPPPSVEPPPPHGDKGHGLNAHQPPGLAEGDGPGNDEADDDTLEPEPISGLTADHGHGHPWFDDDWVGHHGPGHGHGHGPGHGHGHHWPPRHHFSCTSHRAPGEACDGLTRPAPAPRPR
jgi:hypothetical protein